MFPEFGGDSSAQTDNFMTKRASGRRPTATLISSAGGWSEYDPAISGQNEGREAKNRMATASAPL